MLWIEADRHTVSKEHVLMRDEAEIFELINPICKC